MQRNNFVYFGDVQKNVIHRLETSKIFLCFPFGVFETVPIYENKCLSSYLKIQNIYKQHLANSSVLRIFVQVSDPFWGKLRGKTILSSIFNQLYFYSQDSLLLYLVGEDADIYQAYFGAGFQKDFMNFDSLSQKLKKLLAARLHSLTKYYTTQNVVPSKICWRYWPNGSVFWITNRNRTTDVYQQLMYPLGKDSDIVYLNCDISFNHGWLEVVLR